MNPYKLGLEPYIDIMHPMGKRVKLKAIHRMDGNSLSIHTENSHEAICHEVLEVGPDVEPGRLSPGDIVVHISAAGDLVDHTDEKSRHCIVHVDDIIVRWSNAEALEVFSKLTK